MTVKEVKAKELPPLDEDFAIDGGFDDLEQLREDISERLLEADEAPPRPSSARPRSTRPWRAPQVELTPELVEARASEMWERMLHSLSHRGISREAYLRITGTARRRCSPSCSPRPSSRCAARR